MSDEHTELRVEVEGDALGRAYTIPRPFYEETNEVLGQMALGGD